ncbi:MarR family winged helix-turn-helix transcriptional regulator [Stenotrophobium rhamnosiphilum]|uniref:MarR family transcriptional regulator n=1 Tax=Stenotrophobium rhamnosiphilum TaxID=2029166 RepID=A0A2T5MCE5_9GAMM|nr:MarR family transcriptional regulator [Stenotrophobium rhamnosiphilum]PTU30231.1 MarR family transcriptional regulator [Stenotrophobium rhamnosiphilum]
MSKPDSPSTTCAVVEQIDSAVRRVSAIIPGAPKDDIRLVRLIHNVAADMSARFDGMLRPHGLNETDFRTLMQLFCSPEGQAHPSDLSQFATQSRTNMTRIVDSLVERGWVTRYASDVDRRRIVLAITQDGEALVKRLLPQFHPKLSSFLSILSVDEKETMTEGLKKIAASLEASARGGKS